MSLEVRGLSFAYGGRDVLRDVTFQAREGDMLCVLGPNGAGKSTLFRCLLGFQPRYGGSIAVDGCEVRGIPPAELAKKIAYIPQSTAPAFNYSVLDTVLMGTTARISRFASPGPEQKRIALEAMERFGIGHLRDRGIAQISGGERQLALIARAVAQKASTLILDEPASNLDYGNQIHVMQEIRRLADQGHTVILSTHNPEHALIYASRVMVLRDGGVLCCGAPGDVLTGGLIAEVYQVRVSLETVESGGRRVRVCIPAEGPETNNWR